MNDSKVYYGDFYWNDLNIVREHINKLISGDKNIDYLNNFRLKTKKKFKKAFVLNCGNGHVERDFIKGNVIESAIGIDISSELLEQANSAKGNMDIEYIKHDVNSFDFNSVDFDLLIIFSAAHHIQFLNKVFASTREILVRNKGMVVGFDYIGPHRNQYSYKVWEKMFYYNKKLPKEFQKELVYPHLPTMLVTDPSEAIHSELLEENLRYYFDLEFKMLGGGIAYEIISKNKSIQKMNEDNNKNSDLFDKQILEILSWDLKESKCDHSFNFFTSFYGFPRENLDQNTIAKRINEENNFENNFEFGTNYYPKTFLQTFSESLIDSNIQVSHKQAYIDQCHKKLDELKINLSHKQAYIDQCHKKLDELKINLPHEQAYIDQLHRKISELNNYLEQKQNYIEILNKENLIIRNPFKRILRKILKSIK